MSSFTTTEKTDLMFKKILGKPSTSSLRIFYEEPSRPSRSEIIADTQLWSSKLPAVAPSELFTLTDNSLDDLGGSMAGSLVGKTSTNGIVKRFIKIPLTAMIGSNGESYESPLSTVSHPMGNNTGSGGVSGHSGTFNRVAQDIIPFNHDPLGSYSFNLYTNSGQEISFGFGEWNIDNSGGIVTFYQYTNVSGIVSADSPPLLSFYKYTGLKGFPENVGVTIFSGGVNNSLGDNLAALQISDNNPTILPTNQLIDSLNFGISVDGSWRITVAGGGNDPTKTRLVIQKRIGLNDWCTKGQFV
jgi:hypothetical protein